MVDQEARNKDRIRNTANNRVARAHNPGVARIHRKDRIQAEVHNLAELVRSSEAAHNLAAADHSPEAEHSRVEVCIPVAVLPSMVEVVEVAAAKPWEVPQLLSPGAAVVAFGQTRSNSAGA